MSIGSSAAFLESHATKIEGPRNYNLTDWNKFLLSANDALREAQTVKQKSEVLRRIARACKIPYPNREILTEGERAEILRALSNVPLPTS